MSKHRVLWIKQWGSLNSCFTGGVWAYRKQIEKSSCKLWSINHFYDFLPLFGSFSLPFDLGNLDGRKAIYFSRTQTTSWINKFDNLTPQQGEYPHLLSLQFSSVHSSAELNTLNIIDFNFPLKTLWMLWKLNV